MGADYYIYTEIKRKDGSWHALNGKYYNEKTNNYTIAETYWSGSRTYFSRTYQKLRELGSFVQSKNISAEVLEKEDWIDPNEVDNNIVAVSLSDFRNAIPETSRHQCCGYVHKNHIWDYEIDGNEIDEYLSAEEYKKLSKAEKMEYEFYEWDDPTEWYIHFKEISQIVNFQIEEYMRVNHMMSEPGEIRLVCIVSY